jgi:hypothetical protein
MGALEKFKKGNPEIAALISRGVAEAREFLREASAVAKDSPIDAADIALATVLAELRATRSVLEKRLDALDAKTTIKFKPQGAA